MKCEYCGKEFEDSKNYAKDGKDLIYFCSKPCALDWLFKKKNYGIAARITE